MGLTVTSAFQRNELTAILVKQALPFERRIEQAAKLKPMWNRDLDAPF
jgi:antitoxin component of RelBE/YafQ-DinJ toxin-antitoxin module